MEEDKEDKSNAGEYQDDLKALFVLIDEENQIYDEVKTTYSKVRAYADFLEKDRGVKITIKSKADYNKEQ